MGPDSPKGGGGAPERPLLERTAFLITPMGCPELSQLSVSQRGRHLCVSGGGRAGNGIEIIMLLWPLLVRSSRGRLGVQGGSHQQV